MSVGLITLLMFASLFVCIALGIPIAFALGSVGIIFTTCLWGWRGLYVVAARCWYTMLSPTLVAVPLFILLGALLQRAGLADALYDVVYKWAGKVRGALAMGTVVICVFIGAMSAVSGAAAVSLGLIAIPSMLKRNYNKIVAVGTVAGGATLCLIVPPSITLILFGAMSNVSIGQLFIAGIIPGILLASLFMIYLAIQAKRHPEQMPPLPPEERVSLKVKAKSTLGVLPTVAVIVVVLGSIFTGMATPTEAASVGAVATMGAAAIFHKLNLGLIKTSSIAALKSTSMVLWILVGAYIFAAVYQALGATEFIEGFLLGIGVSRWFMLGVILLIVLVLGMFISAGAIVIMLVPIAMPLIEAAGFNILWFAILFNVAIMIGYLSPPFGLVLFYMKGVCPEGITMGDIYRAVLPFIVLELIGMGILILFPEIILWLPRLIMGEVIVG